MRRVASDGPHRLLAELRPAAPVRIFLANVVLTAAGTSGASLWSAAFSSSYAGVLFRNQGDPVLNLSNPPGIPELQHYGLTRSWT